MRLTGICYRYYANVKAMKFNNYWHLYREVTVKESGDEATLTAMGIKVYTPEEVLTTPIVRRHPKVQRSIDSFKPPEEPVIRSSLKRDETHPNWHDRAVHSFTDSTYFPLNHQLDIAKNLTKSVEIEKGLPKRIMKEDLDDNVHSQFQEIIRDSHLFDSTQEKLPRNYVVPYIGWSIADRMTGWPPYNPHLMSWQWKSRRDYGIPVKRKNLNLTKGIVRLCDFLVEGGADRSRFENNIYKQYFERLGNFSRIYVNVPFTTSAAKPIEPYIKTKSTSDLSLPNIEPMEPVIHMWPVNIYREENNFPILHKSHSHPHLHTIFDNYNSHMDRWNVETYHCRALVTSFVSAMGQARLLYGPDFSGELPEPIVVHFIITNGQKFHFSVFQLNTLNLKDDSGVKNVFWHEPELSYLYDNCAYEKEIPTLKGYNSQILEKILAMYKQ